MEIYSPAISSASAEYISTDRFEYDRRRADYTAAGRGSG